MAWRAPGKGMGQHALGYRTARPDATNFGRDAARPGLSPPLRRGTAMIPGGASLAAELVDGGRIDIQEPRRAPVPGGRDSSAREPGRFRSRGGR